MSRSSRVALVILAAALLVAPALTAHPAVAHLYAAGLSDLSIEMEHPRVLGFIALALLMALPAAGFLYSLLRAARGYGDLRALHRISRPARLDEFSYRVLPSDTVVVFTAGFVRPVAFVSQGAERSLGPTELRAALLHERAHQQRRDVFWRVLLKAVAGGFVFLPWVASAVEAETLRSECAADDYALRAGARRRALFNAIAAAAAPPETSFAAGVTGANAELRLTRLVYPETPLPEKPTAGFLALAAAVVLPAVIAHVVATAAAVGVSQFIA